MVALKNKEGMPAFHTKRVNILYITSQICITIQYCHPPIPLTKTDVPQP